MTELQITSRDAVRGFADAINRCVYADEVVVVTRRGRPVAAIVGLGDLDRIRKAPHPRKDDR